MDRFLFLFARQNFFASSNVDQHQRDHVVTSRVLIMPPAQNYEFLASHTSAPPRRRGPPRAPAFRLPLNSELRLPRFASSARRICSCYQKTGLPCACGLAAMTGWHLGRVHHRAAKPTPISARMSFRAKRGPGRGDTLYWLNGGGKNQNAPRRFVLAALYF